jgi:hypothetical protein
MVRRGALVDIAFYPASPVPPVVDPVAESAESVVADVLGGAVVSGRPVLTLPLPPAVVDELVASVAAEFVASVVDADVSGLLVVASLVVALLVSLVVGATAVSVIPLTLPPDAVLTVESVVAPPLVLVVVDETVWAP